VFLSINQCHGKENVETASSLLPEREALMLTSNLDKDAGIATVAPVNSLE